MRKSSCFAPLALAALLILPATAKESANASPAAAESAADSSTAASPPAKSTKAAKALVAVYDLDGLISESGISNPGLLDFSMDASRPLTLLDLTRSLGKAAADPAVNAVVVDADGAELDFAQLQEIRRGLRTVREAGKDVWLYTERLSNQTALLGSAANHFTLMPAADCSFHGIHSESMYFKGLLDRIGVRAEVIHIGDFKSFGETFYRSGPSEPAQRQQDALIDSVFTQLVDAVAEGRKLPRERVLELIDDGTLNVASAVEAGLADHAMHRSAFADKLRETYGKDAKFERSYELPDLDGPEITGVMDLMKLMFQSSSSGRRSKTDFVAVVAMDGDISDESVAPVRREILRLTRDPRAKALVLRVNSPGGSALASEVLWDATRIWKDSGRPFVVSMGGVAASGGYYISSYADRIFAEGGTITGSIGVVGMKFVLGGAMETLGITTHETQRGKNAGAMSMTRGFTDQEADLVRQSMTEVYDIFKKRITDGRGEALKAELESIAGGRVFSGRDALGVGLVDEIGGLAEAIAHASKAAELDDPEVRLVPEPRSALEGAFQKREEPAEGEIIRAQSPQSGRLGTAIATLVRDATLGTILPEPARAQVLKLSNRIESFQSHRVLMLAPDFSLR
jgi:protease-4